MADVYSPGRRTALVLTGTGADGAYHAGVLRALNEAGIKIDVVSGRGAGVASAVFAAIDGASRLWDAGGLWRSAAVPRLYRWRLPVRVVIAAAIATAVALAAPLLFVAGGLLVYLAGLLLGMAGLEAGPRLMSAYSDLLARAFAPEVVPTWIPRLVTAAVIVAVLVLAATALITWLRAPLRRRSRAVLWTMLGAPLDVRATRHFVGGLWHLLRGGAPLQVPAPADLSRRYAELLQENLGQPGFSELVLVVHDLDARRDLVFGLVREPFRRALFPPAGSHTARAADAFDLGGLARDHLVDVLRAALAVPGVTEPALVRFAPDTFWRGESHRLVDRPASLGRLLEEAAAAGAEQVIVVSAAPDLAGPHELRRPRLDPLGRLSEHAAASESAALRDALQHVQHRFRAVYQIRPLHNPVGAFDLGGAYDERSDRHHSIAELMERGYQDAYQVFIDPVVAASGEHLRTEPARGAPAL